MAFSYEVWIKYAKFDILKLSYSKVPLKFPVTHEHGWNLVLTGRYSLGYHEARDGS